MSWLMVFSSTYVPILALCVLVLVSRHQHETQSTVPRGTTPELWVRLSYESHPPASSPRRPCHDSP